MHVSGIMVIIIDDRKRKLRGIERKMTKIVGRKWFSWIVIMKGKTHKIYVILKLK